MNEREFEAQLKTDGYREIELQELIPRPGKGGHRHHFAIRGLVVTGAFLVTQESNPVTYGPGQIFAVAEGELHDEAMGNREPRAFWWVEKFSKAKTSAGAKSSG